MKIGSWNVNGIRSAWGNGLEAFLLESRLDVLAVQEVKSQRDALPIEITSPPGYQTIWHCGGRPGYSGVGMFVRQELMDRGLWWVAGLGRPEVDLEGRVLTLELPDFFYVTAYFPNSGPGGRRIDFKMDFCHGMDKFCTNLLRRGKPVLLCGDLNIAPEEIDVHSPDGAAGSSGFLPAERAWLRGFLGNGWVDAFRRDHPDQEGHFTWWSFFDDDRRNNRGWRIDSFLASPELAARLTCEIRSDVMGSDHCPIVAEIRSSTRPH